MTTLLDDLRNARQRLVEAKDRLRLAEDGLRDVEASMSASLMGTADGKTAEHRKLQVASSLQADDEYIGMRAAVRQEQYAVEQAQADLDTLIDARRLLEWQIRDRQTAALERLHRPAGDTEAQEVVDDIPSFEYPMTLDGRIDSRDLLHRHDCDCDDCLPF